MSMSLSFSLSLLLSISVSVSLSVSSSISLFPFRHPRLFPVLSTCERRRSRLETVFFAGEFRLSGEKCKNPNQESETKENWKNRRGELLVAPSCLLTARPSVRQPIRSSVRPSVLRYVRPFSARLSACCDGRVCLSVCVLYSG